MSMNLRVQECRVVLGVYGDSDREPHILMGTCEGIQHVPALMADMLAHMAEDIGVRDRMDYFWDGSSVWREVVVG